MGNAARIRSLSQPGLLIQLQEDRLTWGGHIHPWILSSQCPTLGRCLPVLNSGAPTGSGHTSEGE